MAFNPFPAEPYIPTAVFTPCEDPDSWWEFDRVQADTVSRPTKLGYEGRFVWALAGATLIVYDLYEIDEFNRDEQVNTLATEQLKRFDTFSLSQSCTSLFCMNGVAYCFNNTGGLIVDLQGNEEVITFPDEMNSNVHCYNSKLWMVGRHVDENDVQSYYSYDLNSKLWSSGVLTVKKQNPPAFVSDDMAGNVLITNYNNVSITKINATTGNYVSTLRIADGTGANRSPYSIYGSSGREIYIMSENGMITTFNTTADTFEHKYTALVLPGLENFTAMIDDGTCLWCCTEEFVRIEKSTASVRLTNEIKNYIYCCTLDPNDLSNQNTTCIEQDYVFTADGGNNLKDIVKTISHTYQTNQGPKIVDEYLFYLNNNGLFAYRNGPMVRASYANLHAVGMISSGPYDYTGD